MKYYKELESPSKFSFPTLILDSNYKESFRALPINYFAKYESLFDKLKTFHFQLKNIEQQDSIFLMPDLDEDYYILKTFIQRKEGEEFSELESQVLLSQKMNLSKQDIYLYFRWDTIVLKLLIKLHPDNSFYQALLMQLHEALDELESFANFTYPQEKKSLLLPNAWYITKLGDLYNAGDINSTKDCHKETNLVYPFKMVNDLFLNRDERVYKSRYLWLKEKYNNIKKKQCVTVSDCQEFLNYYGTFFTFGDYSTKKIYSIKEVKEDFSSSYGKIYLNENEYLAVPKTEKEYFYVSIDTQVCYERHLYRIILGIISAQLSLYQFFWELYQNSPEDSEEYKKLMDLRRDDILIKCLGLNKVETCLERTITTSSFQFLEDFENYLSRGWNINFEYPYILNKEIRGIVENRNLITEHYFEAKVLEYKRKKKEMDGNIYLSGQKL